MIGRTAGQADSGRFTATLPKAFSKAGELREYLPAKANVREIRRIVVRFTGDRVAATLGLSGELNEEALETAAGGEVAVYDGAGGQAPADPCSTSPGCAHVPCPALWPAPAAGDSLRRRDGRGGLRPWRKRNERR